MHALDHLALSRIGQFCYKWFELPIFPANMQTIYITSTFHDNTSKIMQYLQQQPQLKCARTEIKTCRHKHMRCSLICQGQPVHTPGKGGPTSVKGGGSRKQNTLYALSHTRDAVYSRDPPYVLYYIHYKPHVRMLLAP